MRIVILLLGRGEKNYRAVITSADRSPATWSMILDRPVRYTFSEKV